LATHPGGPGVNINESGGNTMATACGGGPPCWRGCGVGGEPESKEDWDVREAEAPEEPDGPPVAAKSVKGGDRDRDEDMKEHQAAREPHPPPRDEADPEPGAEGPVPLKASSFGSKTIPPGISRPLFKLLLLLKFMFLIFKISTAAANFLLRVSVPLAVSV